MSEQPPPSERRGGAPTGEDEARQKGEWAASAGEGVVPAELGGSDATANQLGEDPELGSAALGAPAASEEPATEEGVDLTAGDRADATAQSAPQPADADEPDLRDAARGPRQADIRSAE